MPATSETRTVIDALYSLADSLSEQRHLMRSIDAGIKELNSHFRSMVEERETPAAAPAPQSAPASSTPAPAPATPPASKMEGVVMKLVERELGFDPRMLETMSEEDATAIALEKLAAKKKETPPPPTN